LHKSDNQEIAICQLLKLIEQVKRNEIPNRIFSGSHVIVTHALIFTLKIVIALFQKYLSLFH